LKYKGKHHIVSKNKILNKKTNNKKNKKHPCNFKINLYNILMCCTLGLKKQRVWKYIFCYKTQCTINGKRGEKMKKIIKYLLVFVVMFTLPSFALADEVETTFNQIDVEENVSLKYTVMGNEKTHEATLNEGLNGIKIYKLDKYDTNNKTEVFNYENITEEATVTKDENDSVYHINKSFEKYYSADDTSKENEVRYQLEYTFRDTEYNKLITYTKEYSYTSESQLGIHINLNEPNSFKTIAPKLTINKFLKAGTPNGTFKFKIKTASGTEIREVNITTEGGSVEVGGSKSLTIEDLNLSLGASYIIEEIDENPDIYELESITSNKEGSVVNGNAITVTVSDVDEEIVLNFTNKSKVDHHKTIEDNEDGTHKISLDVTGENEKSVHKANVVIIMDSSNSMSTSVELVPRFVYTYNASTYNDNRYYDSSTSENRVYYRNGRWRTSDQDHGAHYDGTVWAAPRNMTSTRIEEERNALYDMVEKLLKNNSEEIPDVIDISLVSYNLKSYYELYENHDYTTIYNAIAGVTQSSGTNWEEGLKKGIGYAERLKSSHPDEEVYVIFLTDGEPTAKTNSSGWDHNYWDNWNAASDEAKKIADEYHLYTIFTYGTDSTFINYLNNLTRYAYGDGEYTNSNFGDEYSYSNYFFNATDTSELVKALSKIVNDINLSGIGAVTIEDGTTQAIHTSAGISNLLTVDESSYEYWLTFKEENDKIKVNDIEVTVTNNGNGTYTLTWEDNNSVTVEGKEFTEDGINYFRYRWVANELYNVSAPAAHLEDGSVNWVLSKDTVGVLLDDVRYTVTFDVWPSQYTYDLISDLDNGIKKYSGLDEEIKKYLTYDEETGSYTLRTNTTASLIYDDSRDEEGERTITYVNPEPIETGVSEISIEKKWVNDLDDRTQDSVDIYLTKDGENYGEIKDGKVTPYTLTPSENETQNWKKTIFISTGLISLEGDTAIIREAGHDYSFRETDYFSYNWDLDVNVVRPMIINKELKMLMKTNEITDADELNTLTSKNYLEKDGNKYFRLCSKDNTCSIYKVVADNPNSITATNYRRSNLNITKKVEGDYQEGTTFTFEITVDDSKNQDVWFSVMSGDDFIMSGSSNSETKILTLMPSEHISEIKYNEETGVITYKYDDVLNKVRYAGIDENGNYLYYAGFTFDNANSVVGATAEIKTIEESNTIKDVNYDETSGLITYYENNILKVAKFAGRDENNKLKGYTGYYSAKDNTKVTVTIKPLWNVRFINLPNGSTYTINELLSTGFVLVDASSEEDETLERTDTTVNGNISTYNTKYTVTYVNKYILTEVEVIKEWKNDDETLRPESITVHLQIGDRIVDTKEITAENGWTYKWSELAKYDSNDTLIVYTVTEDVVDNYFTTIDGYKIINTYKFTNVTVTKDWQLSPKSPNSTLKTPNVVVKLVPSNGEEQEQTLSEGNWTYTWNNLPKYYEENGKLIEITYRVEEVSIDGAKEGSNSQEFLDYNETIKALLGIWTSTVEETDNGFKITNIYEAMPTKDIVLKKIDFKTKQGLQGAVFVLYRYVGEGTSLKTDEAPGSNWVYMGTSTSDSEGKVVFDGWYDANGNLILNGLYEGEYRLIETVAPTNHILPEGQWIIFLDMNENEEGKYLSYRLGGSTDVTQTTALKIEGDTIIVPNDEIPDIPSTGGVGMNYNRESGLFLIIISIVMYLVSQFNIKRIKNN